MTLVLGESFTEELAEGHYLDTTLKHSRAGSLPPELDLEQSIYKRSRIS